MGGRRCYIRLLMLVTSAVKVFGFVTVALWLMVFGVVETPLLLVVIVVWCSK